MTFDELVDQAVRDAIAETGFRNPSWADALKAAELAIVLNARKRFNNQLVFNHLRALMRRKKPKQ